VSGARGLIRKKGEEKKKNKILFYTKGGNMAALKEIEEKRCCREIKGTYKKEAKAKRLSPKGGGGLWLHETQKQGVNAVREVEVKKNKRNGC